MSSTPSQEFTALAEKAQRCFISPFNGTIFIYCVEDDRAGANIANRATPALTIDGYQSPPAISITNKNAEKTGHANVHIAQCKWYAAESTFHRIFDGGRHLSQAYMSGRLTISGDMAVMARLHLEDVRRLKSSA